MTACFTYLLFNLTLPNHTLHTASFGLVSGVRLYHWQMEVANLCLTYNHHYTYFNHTMHFPSTLSPYLNLGGLDSDVKFSITGSNVKLSLSNIYYIFVQNRSLIMRWLLRVLVHQKL